MPVIVTRGPGLADDDILRAIAGGLERYLADHPTATAELYRRGKYMVRARVTDPGFKGLTLAQRSDRVWNYLTGVPDDDVADLTFLVVVTPDEREESGASDEFDHPTPVPSLNGLFIAGVKEPTAAS